MQTEEPVNEALITHSPLFSTAKDGALQSSAEQKTQACRSIQQNPTPPQSNGRSDTTKSRAKKRTAKAYQLSSNRTRCPEWLSGYIVDFSKEFHDEPAMSSNMTRAAQLFERAGTDPEAFIEQMCEARRITWRRPNIQKWVEQGKNPAWPNGFPNRMPYFFSVLEDLLGLKAAP